MIFIIHIESAIEDAPLSPFERGGASWDGTAISPGPRVAPPAFDEAGSLAVRLACWQAMHIHAHTQMRAPCARRRSLRVGSEAFAEPSEVRRAGIFFPRSVAATVGRPRIGAAHPEAA